MQKYVKWVVMAGFLAQACASKNEKVKSQPTPANNGKQGAVNNTGNTTANTGTSNLGDAIDGTKVALQLNNAPTTLSQVLAQTGKKVAIVQFVGLNCTGCRIEAQNIQQLMAADPATAASLGYIVILSYTQTQAGFSTFAQSVAAEFGYYPSTSIKAMDLNKAGLNSVALDAARTTVMTLIYSIDGRGQRFAAESDPGAIYAAAKTFVSASSGMQTSTGTQTPTGATGTTMLP